MGRKETVMGARRWSVTLEFDSQFARNWFMGQVSDGMMENEVDIDWSDLFARMPDGPRAAPEYAVRVRPNGDLWEHHLRMARLYPSSEWGREVAAGEADGVVFASDEDEATP